MKVKNVKVIDNKGDIHPAQLIVCPDCGGDSFHIMDIHDHNHLQCTKCDSAFCAWGGMCAVQTPIIARGEK